MVSDGGGMDEKERKQYEQLVLTPIHRLIPTLAIPTMASMMTTMLYNLVDAYFVGQIGTSAAAATGVLMAVQAVFQAIGFMMGHGSGTNISVGLGEGDRDGASVYLSTAFFGGMAISTVLMALGLVFLTPLMWALGSTATILPYARTYGIYMLVAGPALTMSCVLNNVMRYEGKAFYAMIGLVSGAVLNMVGDPIFMFALDLGIAGAGLSTALSQYVSLGVLLYMFLSGKTISRLRISRVARRPYEWVHIFRNGMPSLLRQVLNALSTVVLNLSAAPYGDAAIAAMTIDGRVMMLFGSILIGIGQGLQPVAAYNFGARKYARLREAAVFTWKTSEVLLIVCAVFGWVNAAAVVRLFRDDPEVVRIGVVALRCMCVAVVVQPLSVVANMTFQSIRRSREASFLASLRTGICYIPALLVMPHVWGLFGIQSAQMIADILASAISLPFLVRLFRSELPQADEETATDRAYRETAAVEGA